MSQPQRRSGAPRSPALLTRLRDRRIVRDADSAAEEFDEELAPSPDPRAMDLVLRVGELLLASGEATETVNDAMLSLAVAFGLPRSEVSVTFTGITLSCHPGGDRLPVTGERVVRRRTLDYHKVSELHSLVQDAALGLIELEGAIARLRAVKRARPPYPRWMLVAGFGLIASSASVMMGGGFVVAATAFAATVLGDRAAVWLAARGVAEFYQMAVAALLAASTGMGLLWVSGELDLGLRANAVITGSIMALLPGRPLVSSLQDGISGAYVSSSARLLEVFFTLGAIVTGVSAVAYTAIRLGVYVDLDNLPSAGTSMEPAVLAGAAGIAVAFGISLVVPVRTLPPIGVMGVLIWLCYAGVREALALPPVVGTAAGAVAIGVIGHWLARRTRRPALTFIVPSIAPLLPGSILYRGLIQMSTGDPLTGVASLGEAVAVGLALGAGATLGGELVRAFSSGGLVGAGRRGRQAAHRTRGGY
ncbi:threonine/serine exporter family protein [Thermobifida halotolerans]|uniref:Threonine/serine exporter family protein n=1 Tax=Thermobifida halotolerans TaxID=483545 RepID=A0AA97M5V5_9ACTN|nr:threonine/serine exporter family protein [Thermobifida halotolerans]UOE21593.1 threonine/serine exporter family protein [Thermobifida halotolerans]